VSEASIARLACTYALPRDREVELRAGLDRVLEGRLAGAVATALAPLDDVDPGAVWVVRSLRADALVSASDDDLDALAAQWGSQLAGGIMDVIRRGPGGNVVRFGSRAEYLASFAAAVAERRAHTWLFEPLAGLRLLAPATAIRTGAESSRIRVADVVAELAALGKAETVLSASSAAEAAALWAACLSEAAGRRASMELVERVAAAAARVSTRAAVAEPAPARALRTFAAVAATVGRGTDVVAAVDALVGGGGDAYVTSTRRSRPLEERPVQPRVRGGEVTETYDDDLVRSDEHVREADVFAALAAPAFMILPSLEAVGLADEQPGVRARILERLLDCPVDQAILLAAGAEDDLDVEIDGPALVETLVAALEADDRPEAAARVAVGDPDDAVALATRAAVEHFARRLLGFDHASTPYLVDCFLPPGGVVTVTADTIHAELQPAPLAVVLVMAGLDTFVYRVPWLEQDVVVTHRAG
jgi:hypothetical protein